MKIEPLSVDPLREGLVLLCRQLGATTSMAELGDGVALNQGRLPLELVQRVLRRAGVEGRVRALALEMLSPRLLPVLLCMRDGSTAVLVECGKDEAVLLLPESGGGTERISREALTERYAGHAVVARVTYSPDERAGVFATEKDEHWLRGPIQARWKAWAEVALAALMANLLAISTSIFAMQVYDRVVPNAAYDTLWILASGVALAVVMEFVLRSLRVSLLDATGKSLDLELSTRMFERVMQLKLAAKPASTGAFSAQIREFESVREFYTSSTVGLISDLPFVVFFIGVIAFIGSSVAWVVVATVILMLLPGLLTQGVLARLSRQNLREGSIRQGVLLESIENLETVKATRAEGRNLRLWVRLSSDLAEVGVRSRMLSALLGYGASTVQQLGYIGVVVAGVYRIGNGEMTVGALIACTMLASRTMAPMSQVAVLLARWQHVKVAMEGLESLMTAPVERPAGRAFVRKPRLRGCYQLEEVVVRYQQDAPEALALKSFKIAAGERVALLGGNGAGKSTLLRILAGLNDPGSGRVVLDDINLGQIEPADRRQAIGYLPQDIALFYGTLRENLLLDGAPHSDDVLLMKVDAVGLGDFVRRHPLGLDMLIAGNSSVSGGQRQAIGLARLLLQDPRIVLLDEPTSAFDQNNEQRVVEFLGRWLIGRTLVLSTHKTSLLSLVTRTVVLRDGMVVLDGPADKIVKGNQVRVPLQRGKTSNDGQLDG